MKYVKYIIAIVVTISVSAATLAQPAHTQMNMKAGLSATKTETIKVSGNCGSCKDRIEKAAKLPGVSKADWNAKTKLLTVCYDSKKVTIDAIQKSIAVAGHDTPKYKTPDKVYKALPACCKYR